MAFNIFKFRYLTSCAFYVLFSEFLTSFTDKEVQVSLEKSLKVCYWECVQEWANKRGKQPKINEFANFFNEGGGLFVCFRDGEDEFVSFHLPVPNPFSASFQALCF